MIYLLTRLDNLGYDEDIAKVIRANSKASARRIANETCRDEGQLWDDLTKVKIESVFSGGDEEQILASFNAG